MTSFSLELDQSVDLDLLLSQFGCATKIGQVNDKSCRNHLATRFADQIDGGICSSSRGDQVVDEQHPVAAIDRIRMDLDTVHPIFQRIVLPHDLAWQLALFANGHKSSAKNMRDRSAKNEAACFYTGHIVDIALEKWP